MRLVPTDALQLRDAPRESGGTSHAAIYDGMTMSEADYARLDVEGLRAEWVGGRIELMSPVSFDHVDIQDWLISVLRTIVEQRDLGRVVSAEYAVRFGRLRRQRLPDIKFVVKSRLHLFKKNHLEGAPDLAVEIVSEDSQTRDRRVKFDEYRKAGVREYWIVDPLTRTVEVYVLRGKAYERLEPGDDRWLASTVLPGFRVLPEWFWERPSVVKTLRKLGLV